MRASRRGIQPPSAVSVARATDAGSFKLHIATTLA
jgi:hypothetical protein